MSGAWQVVLNGVVISGGGSADGGFGFGEGPFGLGPFGGSLGGIGGFLTTPPQGLGKPGLRVEDQVMPQRDGTTMFADWYEPRIITLDEVSIPASGTCDPASAARRARMLTDAWGRHCGEVELVIYTDANGTAERELVGPFGVRGRPRVAEITWLPGPKRIGVGTFRFDSVDHRLYVLDEDGTPGSGGEVFGLDVQERSLDDPQPDGGNRVDNGDNETSPLGWTGGSRVTTVAKSPTHSNQVAPGASSTSPWFAVAAGAAYDFETYVQTNTSPGAEPAITQVTLDFDSGASAGTNLDARGTSWKRVAFSGVAPVGATQGRIIYTRTPLFPGSGSAFFDDAFYQQYDIPLVVTPEDVAISGSLCVPATITFTGPLTVPRLYVYDNYVGWSDVLDAGETLIIDTETGTATVNGVEDNSKITGDPFLVLPPGESEFAFTTLDGADTGDIAVSYRPAVVSA